MDASRGPNEGDGSVDDFGFSLAVSRDAYFSGSSDSLFYFVSGQYAHQDSAIDDKPNIDTTNDEVATSANLALRYRVK